MYINKWLLIYFEINKLKTFILSVLHCRNVDYYLVTVFNCLNISMILLCTDTVGLFN